MPHKVSTSSSESSVVYHHDVLEFVQVAVQYCSFLEQLQGRERNEMVETLLKLMPLLYLKAQLLPRVESDGSFVPDAQVTEADYDFVRQSAYAILGNDDQYLDVSYDEMMQTDETRWKSLSEHLADIYQPVRNFLATYQQGVEDCMYDALWELVDQFELYWGEALVDALRRLHRIRFAVRDDIGADEF